MYRGVFIGQLVKPWEPHIVWRTPWTISVAAKTADCAYFWWYCLWYHGSCNWSRRCSDHRCRSSRVSDINRQYSNSASQSSPLNWTEQFDSGKFIQRCQPAHTNNRQEIRPAWDRQSRWAEKHIDWSLGLFRNWRHHLERLPTMRRDCVMESGQGWRDHKDDDYSGSGGGIAKSERSDTRSMYGVFIKGRLNCILTLFQLISSVSWLKTSINTTRSK